MRKVPKLMPRQKPVSRQVFLSPQLWEDLTLAAKFHDLAFQMAEAGESVSRNDLIESFLEWALEAYWDDKGGKPTSERDRQDKAKRAAEQIKREIEEHEKVKA